MRIDVDLHHRDLDAELSALHARVRERAAVLHDMPSMATRIPGLVFRYREADGEFFVYAEDPSHDALAGCTVFNRVLEVDRRTDPYIRSPHSRYAEAYQRKGLATAVYGWALGIGMCLVSGPRQSPGAHRLWMGLSSSYELVFVQVRDKRLRIMGPAIEPATFDAFETRMLLLGTGWTLQRFAAATQCELAGDVALT
jgi:hypothetical protein